jgi:hypothetical protein
VVPFLYHSHVAPTSPSCQSIYWQNLSYPKVANSKKLQPSKVRRREPRSPALLSSSHCPISYHILALTHTSHRVRIMLSRSSKSSTFSRSSSAEQDTIASGIILSLKLGKSHRKTLNFTFSSDAASTPLFYVQIATNSIKMMNLHANSAFTRQEC